MVQIQKLVENVREGIDEKGDLLEVIKQFKDEKGSMDRNDFHKFITFLCPKCTK